MKKVKYYLLVSLILIGLSISLFSVHFAVFGQIQNTLYYSLMSLCFIPINVLAVTLVFENILAYQAKQEKLSTIHLRDEILFIQNKVYPEEDYVHITGDIVRVYKSLTLQ